MPPPTIRPQTRGNAPPILTPYTERRTREHLLPDEVDALLEAAASSGRFPHRDSTLILMMYRHALRVSEVTGLRWEQVNFKEAVLHVARRKGGVAATHPLNRVQRLALQQLRKENANLRESPFVFLSSRRSALSTSTVRKIVARAGRLAELPLPVHPHMLRHSCGYYLAAKGVDTRAIQHYLGHANIQNTTIYTALSPERFRGFWPD